MRMAIPYYGKLLRPGLGLERVYFQIELDSTAEQACPWSLQVWDPLKTGLCRWLQKQGISKLVCRDSYSQLESELVACGIQTHWGQDDSFEMMVARCQLSVD